MKSRLLTLLLVPGLILMASCGAEKKPAQAEQPEAPAEPVAESVTYKVNTEESSVMWTGSKVTYSHHGTIAISSGELNAKGEDITGGNFTVDMSAISPTDENYKPDEGKGPEQLVGHLSSPDFFDVAAHPTSTFEITGVTNEGGQTTVSGNLTIKGITKNISFPATISMEGGTLTADAEFTIDRTDWDVKYGSGKFTDDIADNLIGDDISYKVHLVASK